MKYKISDAASKGSIVLIDEILAMADDYDDFISLSAGSPAFKTFPLEKLQKYAAMSYETDPSGTLSYPPEHGMTKVIGEIKKWLEGRGFDLTDREIFLTPGSGPGMDVMANAFCNEGDVILTEEFSYPGIMGAARMTGAKIVAVKNDPDGINLEDLDAKAKEFNPKFLYIIPTFSNPCGITLSEEKRKGIYEIARKYDFMIYEDDPYSQLRFEGEHVKELVNMDPDKRVVHAETFSKYLSSGIRFGFLLYPKAIDDPIVYAFGNAGGPSGPTTEMVALFMQNEDFPAQVRSAAEYYKNQCAVATAALDKYLPEGCTRTNPEGGMFVWVTCPDSVDTEELCWDLIKRKHVGMVPSSCFAPDPDKPGHGFRISYSIASPEELEKGIAAIGELLKERI